MTGTLQYQPPTEKVAAHWVMKAHPHIHLRAKRVFPKLKAKATGELILSDSIETCRDLAWFLERFPLELQADDRSRLTSGAHEHVKHESALQAFFDKGYVAQPVDLALPPRTYQAKEAAIVLHTGALLVADDVGLGKTVSGICLMQDLRARPTVVVTLAGAMPKQWADMVNRFAPDLFVHVVKTSKPYPLPMFMGRGPDVIILNYHKLFGWASTLGAFAQAVIFDEVQELRHGGTGKYTAAEALCASVKYRMGLSATPIYNYGGEMFNVMNLLSPGCLGTWEEFFTEWCIGYPVKARIKDPVAFGSWLRAQGLMVRHRRSEVGRELPPVTRVTHTVETDEDPLAQVEQGAAELARRILSKAGGARGDRMRDAEELSVLLRQATGIAKARYVADFVRLLVESGEQVVLFGWHRAVYDIWLSRLKDLNPAMFTGSESTAQKYASKAGFISGHSKVLIMSLRSGAGLDGLQGVAHIVVMGELDYSPGVHEQNIGRIHRDGQAEPVIAYFLVADEGSDPVVAEIVGLKTWQVDGIRNEHTDLIAQLQQAPDAIPMLARRYLEQIGQPLPVNDGAAA